MNAPAHLFSVIVSSKEAMEHKQRIRMCAPHGLQPAQEGKNSTREFVAMEHEVFVKAMQRLECNMKKSRSKSSQMAMKHEQKVLVIAS